MSTNNKRSFFLIFLISYILSNQVSALIAPNTNPDSRNYLPELNNDMHQNFIAPSTSRTEETLIRDGFQLIYKYSCVNFKGCYYNHAYILGRYKFICEETRYHITYRCEDVLIFAKSIYHPSINESTNYHYICAKNHYCFRGKLVPW